MMHVVELEWYEKETNEIDGTKLKNGNKNKNTKHNNNGVWKMEEGNEWKKAYGDGWDVLVYANFFFWWGPLDLWWGLDLIVEMTAHSVNGLLRPWSSPGLLGLCQTFTLLTAIKKQVHMLQSKWQWDRVMNL